MKIKTLAVTVVPHKGTCVITEVPAHALKVGKCTFAVAKILGKWGVYAPKSGLSVCGKHKTMKDAIDYAEPRIEQSLDQLEGRMGTDHKTEAAIAIGNVIKFTDL